LFQVLDTIGLAEPILEHGIRCAGTKFFGNTDKLLQVDFAVLEGTTPFPYSFLISQHTVEKIFRDKLTQQGISVYAKRTVIDIRNSNTSHGLEVVFADGSVTHAKYIIGADGAHSTVCNSSHPIPLS
jgi:2-polyprenyl-6-methoxyphenol hydroxylase-like FAD-dependent oxidoreductase